MASEKRLIDAYKLNDALQNMAEHLLESGDSMIAAHLLYCQEVVDLQPTVDAVEVSSLGKLGQLMMPYTGCPRGMIGPSGDDGTGYHLTELGEITDVDGNRWVPVFENDLSRLKAKVDAVEVVHSQWDTVFYERNGTLASYSHICPECKYFYRDTRFNGHNYCPNCGAKMDGDLNG